MKKFFDEFKTFIARGNVMDMAVGVIIGGPSPAPRASAQEKLLTEIRDLLKEKC